MHLLDFLPQFLLAVVLGLGLLDEIIQPCLGILQRQLLNRIGTMMQLLKAYLHASAVGGR